MSLAHLGSLTHGLKTQQTPCMSTRETKTLSVKNTRSFTCFPSFFNVQDFGSAIPECPQSARNWSMIGVAKQRTQGLPARPKNSRRTRLEDKMRTPGGQEEDTSRTNGGRKPGGQKEDQACQEDKRRTPGALASAARGQQRNNCKRRTRRGHKQARVDVCMVHIRGNMRPGQGLPSLFVFGIVLASMAHCAVMCRAFIIH